MTEHRITITENPSIHVTRDGSTINHTVAIGGECLGWVVEHRSPSGETLGWSIWGKQASVGLFASRDAAAKWLTGRSPNFSFRCPFGPENEFY